MKLKFFMPMKPPTVTHQEKQVHVVKGKPVFYEPEELKNARAKLMSALARNIPEKPFDGPLFLSCDWYFPVTGKHRNGEFKTTKPDTDNLNKLLKDCMTAMQFWKDDAQVCMEVIAKYYADVPGIKITVSNIENDYKEV